MQILNLLPDWVLWCLVIAFIAVVYMYYQTTFPHTMVRVIYPGGTEQSFKATEGKKQIRWKDRTGNVYEVEEVTKPVVGISWGRKYRIFTVMEGAVTTTYVVDPAKWPEGEQQSLAQGDIKESNMVSQLASGLNKFKLADRIVHILLGVGLTFTMLYVVGWY